MLKSRIAEIMTARENQPFFSLATPLFGLSILYGGCMRLRRGLYRRDLLETQKLPCPVISVGNLTVGGTGKTPMVIHLAGLFGALGFRPVILSRGYKGQAEHGGAVVSDGKTLLCNARQAGDEPFLMATMLPNVPVMAGKDRYAAGKLAIERFKPDLILLDDGYQHLRLKRDLNILMMDAQCPFGNNYLLPRGTLREPAEALHRADAVVLTRSGRRTAETHATIARLAHPRPLFASRHRSVVRRVLEARSGLAFSYNWEDRDDGMLRGKAVFAFAGLGRNDAFFHAVRRSGAQLVGVMGFEDHHAYSLADLTRIVHAAEDAGAGSLVTSDKDFVRLPSHARFPTELIVMGVNLDFGEQERVWNDYIVRQISGLIKR